MFYDSKSNNFILNTGLLMAKPGESGYAKYRRFLISNQLVNCNSRSVKEELLKQIDESQIQLSGQDINQLGSFIHNYEVAYMEMIGFNKTEEAKPLLNKYKPSKCCQTCAEMGFHSSLFDFSWLMTCPIHRKRLKPKCEACNQFWPASSAISNSKCKSCGKIISLKKLLSVDGLNEKKFKIFETIESLYQKEPPYSLGIRNHLISSESIFHISILAHKGSLNKQDQTLLKQSDIPFYEINQHDLSKVKSKSEQTPDIRKLNTRALKKAICSVEQMLNEYLKTNYSTFSSESITSSNSVSMGSIIKLFFDVLFKTGSGMNLLNNDLINFFCITYSSRHEINDQLGYDFIKLVESMSLSSKGIYKPGSNLKLILETYCFRKLWILTYYLIRLTPTIFSIERYKTKGFTYLFELISKITRKIVDKQFPVLIEASGTELKVIMPKVLLNNIFEISDIDLLLIEKSSRTS